VRFFWSIPCCSGWQKIYNAVSISAGKSDNTGNSTKHDNNKHDAVMDNKCGEKSRGGKSPAYVSHKTDATKIFESTCHYHRLLYFCKKAEDIWS